MTALALVLDYIVLSFILDVWLVRATVKDVSVGVRLIDSMRRLGLLGRMLVLLLLGPGFVVFLAICDVTIRLKYGSVAWHEWKAGLWHG